jgi:hypothetical protein
MRMRAAMMAGLLIAAACAPGPTSGTPAPTGTNGAETLVQDGAFRLTISAERPTYRTSEAIGISATLTYLGPDATVEVMGAGNGLIGFGLRQLDGHLEMDPLWEQSCRTYPMVRGAAVAFPFVKSGGFIDTDPDAAFWRAFFADKVLRLPAGNWRIEASLNGYLGACGGERHQLKVSVIVRVEP